MTDWWESYPLATGPAAPPPQATTDNWWEGYPLASEMPQQPPAASGFLDRAANLANRAANFVTGDNRREFDYGELPSDLTGRVVEGRGAVGGVLPFARTDRGKLRILSDWYPEVGNTAELDRFGNVHVGYGGQRYYLNRPGLSMMDVDEAGTEALATLPFAGYAGRVAKGGGLLRQMAAGGAATGAGSVARDVVGAQAGSGEYIDVPAALTGTALGAAWPVAGRVLAPIYRSLVGRPQYYDSATGALTDAGRAVLRKAGLDPEEISDAAAKWFAQQARTAANPEDAARAAQAATLPHPVPMTAGDISGSPRQQLFESGAAKGALGQDAETVMAGFRANQQDALRANLDAIQGQLSGGTRQVVNRGEGGQVAQGRLVDLASAAKQNVNQLYDTARGSMAVLPVDYADGVAARLRQSIVDDHDLMGLPRITGLLDQFDGMVKQGRDLAAQQQAQAGAAGNALPGSGSAPGLDLKALFDWRRRLNNAMSEGGETAVGGRRLKSELDGAINEALEMALISGEPKAVEAWQKAIAGNAAFAKDFKARDLVGALVQRDPQRGFALRVAPEDAGNAVFGLTIGNAAGKANLVRDLGKVRDLLGPGSPEWNALREEFFLRLAQAGEGAANGAAPMFSGAKFLNTWNNFQLRNYPLVKQLFSEQERRTIQDFANVAAKATNRVAGGDNPSNSAFAAANLMSRMFDLPFMKDRFWTLLRTTPAARNLMNMTETQRAVAATRGGIPERQIPFPAGMIGAGAATDGLDDQ